MAQAIQIVEQLLETDQPLDNEADIAQQIQEFIAGQDAAEKQGLLTPTSALTADYFYSRHHCYKDGVTPIKVRRNGHTKTWKTRPGEFQIPVKYGMYEYFYITQRDADDWSVTPLPVKTEKVKKIKPPHSPSSLMPPLV